MKQLVIEIVTPSKIIYSGNVESCSVPGTSGAFQVLFNHAAILSTFEVGEIKIVDMQGKTIHYATGGGTIEVLDNKILLLAESIENPEDIDVNRAEKSLERAKERLSGGQKPDIDFARAELALHRALNRINMNKKYM